MNDRRPRVRPLVQVLACVLFLTAATARADDWRIGGHLKYKLSRTTYPAGDAFAEAGASPAIDSEIDFRLKAEKRWGKWDVRLHDEFLALDGDTPTALRRIETSPILAGLGLPSDERRLFDLTDVAADSGRLAAVHRLDRASIGWTTGRLALRAGRDAVTWGNGAIFHPLDIVNPFAPTAVDKDYKTGDDMLYGQWLSGGGGDIQAILLPRRNQASGTLRADRSTFAVKYRAVSGLTDLDLVAARHYDEDLLGLGIATGWRGAVWKADVSAARTNEGTVISGVANASYSWTWAGRNVTGTVEYCRNGFGREDGRYDSEALGGSPSLVERIERGEIFTLGRDYLAGTLTAEMTPRLLVAPTAIANLNDGSALLQATASYDWKQETVIAAGLRWPIGPRGTEFGGIPTGTPGAFLSPGRSVYVRMSFFF